MSGAIWWPRTPSSCRSPARGFQGPICGRCRATCGPAGGFPTRREHPTLNDRLRRNRDSSFRRRHRSRPVSPALPHFRYLNPSGSAVRTAGSGECRRWPRSGRSPCPSHHGERDPLPGHKSSFNDIWRMRWDSNPRNLSVRWFSRPVPSTARPLIRRRNSGPVPSSTRPRVR